MVYRGVTPPLWRYFLPSTEGVTPPPLRVVFFASIEAKKSFLRVPWFFDWACGLFVHNPLKNKILRWKCG